MICRNLKSGCLRVVLILTSVTSLSLAEEVYVAQNATGGDLGSSCASAHSASWFNTAANWGTGTSKVSAGDTVHLCGTFSGAVGSTMLTIQAAGAAGNPITIVFEPDALLTSPAWGSALTGAIQCTGKNYIVLDGGTNGRIVNTANGTNLANHRSSIGVLFDGCNNSTIKNLTIDKIYVHTPNMNDPNANSALSTVAINMSGSNVSIIGNTTTDAQAAVGGGTYGSADSNFEISGNSITNCNRCVVIGVSTTSYTGVKIHDNDFGGGAYLWDQPDNYFHHNAVHVFNTTSGSVNGLEIYNNYVHGSWGADNASNHTTSMFFVETTASSTPTLIYNNVMAGYSRMSMPTNGYIFCKITGNACSIYNNTILGVNDGAHYGTAIACNSPQTVNISNNLIAYMTAIDNVCARRTINNNVYNDVDAWAGYNSFSAWQGAGYDVNGRTASAALTTAYRPGTGSSLIGAGANLSSVGVPTLNSDKAGTVRPSSGSWTSGAYQDSPAAITLNPPSALSATVLNTAQ